MKAGLYLISAILFVIAVAVAAYMINPGYYSFDVFGIHMPSLPIALWIALPVALLAIFSLLHILFYGAKSYFTTKKWKSDAKKVEDAIYWSLIKEPQDVHFANEELRKGAGILAKSYIEPLSTEDLQISERIRQSAKIVQKIENGEFVDLKKEKIGKHISNENPLYLQNEKNHINANPKYALKVLDFKERYPQELVSLALDKLVATQDLFTIKKYAKEIRKERFLKLLERLKEDKETKVTFDIIKSFIQTYNLNCKEYIKVVKFLLEKFDPDNNLELLSALSKKDEDALPAYIYLLFRYEMLDKVKEILDEHSEDEYKAFRALYLLKKQKHNFKLSDFINEENSCL